MNKSRLIGGIVMLTLGIVFGILTVVLPPEKLMFQVEGRNAPVFPSVILAIIGVVLILITVLGGRGNR